MSPPRRILLLQLRAIGDVILTTPAIRVLKKRFPEASLDFLANPIPAEVLSGNPNLHRVLIYPYAANDVGGFLKQAQEVRKGRYDAVIDFLGTPATALLTWASGAPIRIGYSLRWRRFLYNRHEVDYRDGIYNALTKFCLLKPLGVSEEEVETEIFIPAEAREWAQEKYHQLGLSNQRVVALAPHAKRPARQWPPERFAQLAGRIQERGYKVLLLWGPGERETVDAVAKMIAPPPIISPPTTLMQMAALLERCRLLVCNCGGTKHVAVAVGTPTFTIHGPTDPRAWTPPDDPRHQYVRDPSLLLAKVTVEQVLDGIQKMAVL